MRFVAVPPQVRGDAIAVLDRAFREATQAAEYERFLNENYIERRELAGPELTARIKPDLARYRTAMTQFGIAIR